MFPEKRLYPFRSHEPPEAWRLRKPPRRSRPKSVSSRGFASRAAWSRGAAPRSSRPSSCSLSAHCCMSISTDGPTTRPAGFRVLVARSAPCHPTLRRPTPSRLRQNSLRVWPLPCLLPRYKNPGRAAPVYETPIPDHSEVSRSWSNRLFKTDAEMCPGPHRIPPADPRDSAARRRRPRSTAALTWAGAVPPIWSRAATEPSSVSTV